MPVSPPGPDGPHDAFSSGEGDTRQRLYWFLVQTTNVVTCIVVVYPKELNFLQFTSKIVCVFPV